MEDDVGYEDENIKDKVRAVLAAMKTEWKFAIYQPQGRLDSKRSWLALKRKDDFPFSDAVPISDILFDLPPFMGDWHRSLVER